MALMPPIMLSHMEEAEQQANPIPYEELAAQAKSDARTSFYVLVFACDGSAGLLLLRDTASKHGGSCAADTARARATVRCTCYRLSLASHSEPALIIRKRGCVSSAAVWRIRENRLSSDVPDAIKIATLCRGLVEPGRTHVAVNTDRYATFRELASLLQSQQATMGTACTPRCR
jgi:hypothetical protein